MARPRWLQVLRRIWVAAGICFTIALLAGYQADGVEEAGFVDDGAVLRFDASRDSARLIFLPGAMVEPKAYAPLLRQVAEAGFPVTLVKLPWRAAYTEAQRRAVFDEIQRRSGPGRWVLAGHSRGGMLAARYLHERVQHPDGVTLIGTTHPRDFDLSALQIPVTKIYGSADGVAGIEEIRRNARLLPATTRWVEIEGGNHAQFGSYRFQLGDHSATISRRAQQTLTARALIEALRR